MTGGRFSQNQALGGRNLRNEQGQRNATTELCTANRVEMFHFLLTLADEVLSTPSTSGSKRGLRCPRRLTRSLPAQAHSSISLSNGIST
jgi:hypothetical protein